METNNDLHHARTSLDILLKRLAKRRDRAKESLDRFLDLAKRRAARGDAPDEKA